MDSKNDLINSSVMVVHDLSTDNLILTKRSENLRNHPGEICFPGGFKEITDENLYETAVRELYEEIGVNADRITLIKELQVEKTLLGTVIHPWLASIQSIKPYRLNTQEVAKLILVPISLVRDPSNYQEKIFERQGMHFQSSEFLGAEECIWGATARIMFQLTKFSTNTSSRSG